MTRRVDGPHTGASHETSGVRHVVLPRPPASGRDGVLALDGDGHAEEPLDLGDG